jgi:hypothetical protein
MPPTEKPTGSPDDTIAHTNKDPTDGIPHPLEIFQTIVGITTPDSITRPSYAHYGTDANNGTNAQNGTNGKTSTKARRCWQNPSLYKRICKLEWRRKWEYRVCTTFISVCYIAQIAFASILTALGASQSSYTVITIFGAINTAIAGVMALLKGQGLPTRLRQGWVRLRKLRDYIEDRERMIGINFYLECKNDKDTGKEKYETSDLQMEIAKIVNMYEEQMKTIEDNMPDVYVFPESGTMTWMPKSGLQIMPKN